MLPVVFFVLTLVLWPISHVAGFICFLGMLWEESRG